MLTEHLAEYPVDYQSSRGNGMEFETIQGAKLPKLGFGTWNLRGEECRRATQSAIEIGYRHIDTAEMYENEEPVGEALRQSGIDRSEFFITTKVYSHLRYADVVNACERSLKKLGVEAVDLYLIHWPSSSMPIEETIRGMNELVSTGKTRLIGVSNFSVSQFDEAQKHADTRIFTNQIPHHPLRFDREMLKYCQQNDVMLTAYSPLAKGRVSSNSTLEKIGQQYGKTASQVALRWLVQQDKVIAIPKSRSQKRQQENFDIFDFTLSVEDIAEIDGLS
jgi:diketogulonate reductase-like aldo/keto reductase